MHYKVLSLRSKNVHSEWKYDSTSKTENVAERGISYLPGLSVVSITATTPWRQQLRTVLGSSVSKLTSHYKYTSLLKSTNFGLFCFIVTDTVFLFTAIFDKFANSRLPLCEIKTHILSNASYWLRPCCPLPNVINYCNSYCIFPLNFSCFPFRS